jgi:hypothetical protein
MNLGKCAVLLVVVLAGGGLALPPAKSGERKADRKAPGAIAWGKANDGLEAGLALRPGEEHACSVGGSLTFHVYLRNATDKAVPLSHIESLFDEFLPKVEGDDGQEVRLVPGPLNLGQVSLVSRTLDPGETIRVGSCWFLVRAPGIRGEAVAQTLVAPPGKYRAYHGGFPIRRRGGVADKYTGPTGRVEFEVTPAPVAR